MPNIRRFK